MVEKDWMVALPVLTDHWMVGKAADLQGTAAVDIDHPVAVETVAVVD